MRFFSDLVMISYLLYTKFLLYRIVFYRNYVPLIVISTGGSFCFRSEEIFLKAMWFLGFIFFNGFIFLMATFMDIWLLCRSLDCARDDNWRIALFLRLVSYLWNVGSLFVRLFSYFYNDSPYCHFDRRKLLLPQWRNLS